MVKMFFTLKSDSSKKQLLSKNGLRISPRALVKLLGKFFFLTFKKLTTFQKWA